MTRHDPHTLIDLFAGCGGMTRGFADAGFRPVLAIEWDIAAAASYGASFPGAKVIAKDIATIGDGEVPEVDVLVGGPPCQGFSGLGKRQPDDVRNVMWREYRRIVHFARPKVFVIENVARFLKSPEFADLEAELKSGSLSEYSYVAGVLRAEDMGVPQRRHRAFVIGSRIGTPKLPTATHGRSGDGDIPSWHTVRDALVGLPPDPPSTTLPPRARLFQGNVVPGPFSEAEIHVGRTYRPDSIRRYDVIPPGGGRLDLPPELQFKCWRNKPKGTTDVLGRMKWGEPSLTIRTEFQKPEKGRYIHPRWEPEDGMPRANRAISHAEAARLQSFDDRQLWCGTKVQIGRQIGNAVPPILALEIARQSVLPLLECWREKASDRDVAARQERLEEQLDPAAALAVGAQR
jgi:DNA (cytosine-5)-methyltransferase 1